MKRLLPVAAALALCAAQASPASPRRAPAPAPCEASNPEKKLLPKTPAEAKAMRQAGARWSNREIRAYYLTLTRDIEARNAAWVSEGKSARDRARLAYDIRHNARLTCRAMMASRAEVLLLRARDLAKYGNPDGPTFEALVRSAKKKGLRGDAVYESIIRGAQRTDQGVTRRLKL